MNDTDIDPRVLDIRSRAQQAQERYDVARLKVQAGNADARHDMIRAHAELSALAAELFDLRERGILR
jgi:hypothetical protein